MVVPPKPSCRPPIMRTTRNEDSDEDLETLEGGHSPPPRRPSSTSHEDTRHGPAYTSDEEDVNNQSENNPNIKLRSDSPNLTTHTAEEKSSNKRRDRRRSDSTKEATKSECSKINSTKGTWTKTSLLIAIVILIIAVIIIPYLKTATSRNEDKSSLDDPNLERIKNFKHNIKDIKSKFPCQNRRIWGEIEAGIIDIIEYPQKPWIFVLFSNATNELSCLAKGLGKVSSQALHSRESLELNPDDLGDDYGLAIEKFKHKISMQKAVVVYDLLNVNPRAIQAFHTMCDRETPLVKEAVYIFTIITPGNVPEFERSEAFIEDQLTNRFINKIPKDKLQPLITRLTDGPILPIKPEISLIGC